MTVLLWAAGIIGVIAAVLVVIALCIASGSYSEQECEDYLRGHYE